MGRFLIGVVVGGVLAVTLPQAYALFAEFAQWLMAQEVVQNLFGGVNS